MVEAIVRAVGIAVALDERRRGSGRRWPSTRRAITRVVARPGVEVADALAIADFTGDLSEPPVPATEIAVDPDRVARLLRAAAAEALAAQARLGPAAVIRLADPAGVNAA